eukprot:CAMPEP_0197577186 /NCGR_PEP_ID=MMETSP1326-20131121/1905_1 /TAXON_ID=1155430 /ORGANISM="Genus nov. species nov., Strain RCC2288" /LENGTH=445 /DNA_ID=CAMNT_0043140211 /DNA_START=98 /DNA_END=1435 /DNA_ORIENTATION=+
MGRGAQCTTQFPYQHMGEVFHPDDSIVLVGAYDHPELLAHTPAPGDCALGKSGVHVVHMSGATGKLTHLTTNAIGPNVAFIVRCPTNPHLLYASTERIDDEGEIITLRMTPDFRLVEESRVKAGGRSTCYLNFNRDRTWMMAVNYWDAKVSMMKLGVDGRPASPNSVLMQPAASYVDETKPTREEHWKFRQRWPHSHCCVTEPYSGRVHFVVDLGLDRVFAYRVDAKEGSLVLKGSVQLPRGKGPRHLAFHPVHRTAYLVNELDSTVSCFKVNLPASWLGAGCGVAEVREEDCLETPGAVLELVQCLSSLPECEQGKTTISPQGIWKAASHSSEIRMHPSGKWFVVGNRGHDSLVVYGVDHENHGQIRLVEITPSGGLCPRNFNWSENGAYLIVGNQNSSSVCTFGFDFAETGHLSMLHEEKNITSPNYIYPISCSALGQLITTE